jgi:hypothetical protein
MSRFSFGLLILLLATTPAAAAFVYGGQNRQVATITGPNGGGGATSDLKDTIATGLWSEIAASAYSDVNGSSSASATQTSNLGDDEISMSGNLAAASNGHVAFALSQLGVTFTTDVDLPYVSTLSATTEVLSFTFVAGGGNVSYGANSSGILPAGVYSIGAEFRSFAYTESGISSASGQYRYKLSVAGVPEPSSAWVIAVGAIVAAVLRLLYNRFVNRQHAIELGDGSL